jgi:hypothetical protein
MQYKDSTCLNSRICPNKVDIMVRNFSQRDESLEIYRSRVVENLDLEVSGEWAFVGPLVPKNIEDFLDWTINVK